MVRIAVLAGVGVAIAFATHASAVAAELTPQQSEGRALFHSTCVYCHGERGPGTTMLGRRLGVEFSLIEERADLTDDYIKTVVRKGVNSMPWYRRTELSNAELDSIAAYLTRLSGTDAP